uniref:NADH dehydrogenase subunit 1 n=1 Tax=Gammarus nipponensis TaxID=353628 RepID=UPI00286BAB5E|nr:NADH dehydrogenase subunit 1 [Gammarus nipponensis]WLS55468.1 NADH dehydrogenase subunit 1 [Gammarus nipponensis]
MELLMSFVSYTTMYVLVVVSVAFVTLMEQKILASKQVRLGPNWTSMYGVMQPFADGVKLLSKEMMYNRVSKVVTYYSAPVLSLVVGLLLWALYPFYEGGLDFSYGVMFFMCVSGLGVYPVLLMGWGSNCKYSMLGSLRAVAQMISYEVSMAVILLSLVWITGSFSLHELMESQYLVWNMFFFMPLSLIWLVSSLAETNRTPYDFSESESELVSGFNTEYGSAGFTLIFVSEYASILFMSMLFVVFFFSSSFSSAMGLKSMMMVFVWVWVRATLPRYRYDKLMGLAWKSVLPVSLMLFIYYLSLGAWDLM